MDVLQEFPGELGLLLWKTFRGVTLWAAAPPDVRDRELFPADAYQRRSRHIAAAEPGNPPRDALEALARVLTEAPPAPAELAEACRGVATWAESQSATGTALAYMQAAALVDAENASLAHATAVIARRRAEYGRAESWFRQAIMLGRVTDDWSTYALASAALGKLFVQRGALPSARRAFVRGVRAAGRHRLHEIQGGIYHDLVAISIRAGKLRDAVQYAGRALEAYGSDHAAVASLARELASFWLERGHYPEALQVFEAVLPRSTDPLDRLHASAGLARAAAGAGSEKKFQAAREATEALVEEGGAADGAAAALLELARASLMLGKTRLARSAAERSAARAAERGEAEVQAKAESILGDMRAGDDTAAPAPRARRPAAAKAVQALADRFGAALADRPTDA